MNAQTFVFGCLIAAIKLFMIVIKKLSTNICSLKVLTMMLLPEFKVGCLSLPITSRWNYNNILGEILHP